MSKILVIDDDPIALATLQLILETGRAADVVESAKSAEAAILLVTATHFDVIVSDIRMPGLNGIDLLKHIQGADSWVPIILLTGDDDLDLEYHARRLGAFGFFQKPVSPRRLLGAVEEAVEESTTWRARQHIREQREPAEAAAHTSSNGGRDGERQ
jgi:two-component system response regulator AauR